ncbi:hypothetical protein KR044_008166, partial [Drosophila immigrans]
VISLKMKAPNLCGCSLWLRHEVSSHDTLASLALRCGTTIGQICRANRLHSQDIVQMRRHVWLPDRQDIPDEAPSDGRVDKPLPPHFQRQSVENLDEFAEDCDPLLITTKC